MHFCRLLFFFSVLAVAVPARSATVLVLQFHNGSQYSDLDWVGESVAETLRSELAEAGQIVFDRDSRKEAMERLALRPGAEFTKATLIRLGQTLDADYVCYGSYEVTLEPNDSALKNSSVQISAHLIDLRKLEAGPDLLEAGALSELSRLEEHLAWQSLRYLEPGSDLKVDDFLAPQKLTRVDAQESYVRGLLSPNKDQQQKWFMQAAALDPQFASPVFELGRLALEKKDYRQALQWFQRIGPKDPHYTEARFKMGLSAYGVGDYSAAIAYFREVLKQYPLNEVYNNLGAAEDHVNSAAAIDDLRHALDGDRNDPVYQFNLAAALLKNNNFDEATKDLQTFVAAHPNDSEARALLDRAQRREAASPGNGNPIAERLKPKFDGTAFRQLKAMLQPKGGG